MVWLKKSDYASKKETVHKTKLPTQLKSKTHKCSLCNQPSIRKVQVSDVEFRWLCKEHFEQWNRQHFSFRPEFKKASESSNF